MIGTSHPLGQQYFELGVRDAADKTDKALTAVTRQKRCEGVLTRPSERWWTLARSTIAWPSI